MGDTEFQVEVAKKNSEEKDQDKKRTDKGQLLQMQKSWLEAKRRIASLEAQVNMHRLREEALVCEMVELRKSHEISQTKFDEERREWFRDMRTIQESKAQNVGKGKAEIDSLKAEIAELKSSLDDAERTRLFLLEDNGKIKQQKAKLRCDYNELKREHNKLLSSQQVLITSVRFHAIFVLTCSVGKKSVLCDRSGTENIPNRSSRNGLRGGNNFGNAVLGLSETCSICISPVSPTQSDNSNVNSLETDSKRNEGSIPRSVNIQESAVMSNVNTEEKKLIEELIEKLKHSDERNQELRKALHTVDEQCEKLVRSFQELKLRYEEKERNLTLETSMPSVALQNSSHCGRSDLETEYSAAKKDHKFLSQKLLDNGGPASNTIKRKYASCLAAFGKRSKNDLC
uniref:Filament-like plant protein 7 n=1 Tax=Elaeophora elaphi TaxID=1147741 RepID=A0A0R3S3I8_9BILA